MTAYELEDEYRRFIEFGGVFDRPVRLFLVHYAYQKLAGQPVSDYKIQQLLVNQQSKYYHYLQQALDKLLDPVPVRHLARQHQPLAQQLLHDILHWLREADKRIKTRNPHQKENDQFAAWSHKPTHLWAQTWYLAVNLLAGLYPRAALDHDFYAKKFKELLTDQPPPAPAPSDDLEQTPLDLLINDLLAAWDALLTAKNLQYYVEEMEQEQQQFSELLNKKVEEFQKLMSIIEPFAAEVSHFWDLSRGLWQAKSFNVLDHYQALLANERSVQELADLLGRMREAQIELEEEVYQQIIVRKEWVPDPHQRAEIAGLRESDDLPAVLPAELALLGHPATEALFLQKYADKSLLSYQFEGKRLVTSDRSSFTSFQKQKKKEKGPFILCIDTSGSMEGLPSQIAKVLCFAIMKMAAKEHRKCYLISFSIGIKTINLLDLANSMDRVIDFLGMSFDGGTDITPALAEALNVLQTADYQDADVMMVSDFVMFDIRPEVLQRIQKEQARGTRFHSLTLSNKPNLQVVSQFDNYWVYDPTSRGIMRKLWQDVAQLA
ncbi:MAG: VWA domain-containing protein [Bernardetiaceae bacterium]|nr:VWA domain-containing protein [Bernardetiaceae bacterium]